MIRIVSTAKCAHVFPLALVPGNQVIVSGGDTPLEDEVFERLMATPGHKRTIDAQISAGVFRILKAREAEERAATVPAGPARPVSLLEYAVEAAINFASIEDHAPTVKQWLKVERRPGGRKPVEDALAKRERELAGK